MKNISFDNPYLLLILIPLLVFIMVPIAIAIRKENRSRSVVISLILHVAIAVCVTLAVGGMIYTTVMTETQVIVVADVSYSTSRNLDEVDELIRKVEDKLPRNATMQVVAFGKDQKILPIGEEGFTTVRGSGVDDSATDIAGALDFAVEQFGDGVIKRIVLITDGKETNTENPGALIAAVENVYAGGIYIDAVYQDSNLAEDAREIQISDVDFAASTYMNREATADVLIQSSFDTNAIAVLYVEGERVSDTAIKLTKGYNVVNIDLPTGSTGRYDYRVAITADGDYCTTNNTFDFTQTVVSNVEVLLITWDEADVERVKELYGDSANVDAYVRNPSVPCTVEELCKYDEIILSNVDVRDLRNYTAFIDGVEKVVSRFGKSFITMGDLRIQNKSDDVLRDLEDMLPVKYGNSDQDPKLYAIVLDTSRSMQNFSRLRIAKQAAIQLLNMLDDDDYVMIVNFWGEINVLQSPTKASERDEIAALINAIEPYQGTVIGAALDKAGDAMIEYAFDDKQIMLISDGMSFTLESDTPADVAQKLHDHEITVSVIHPAAREEGEATLRGIAEAGGGNYFEIITEESLLEIMFSEVADDLTQSVIEGQTPVRIKREADDVLSGLTSLPDVMGYTYAKAKASATTVLTVDYVKAGGTTVEVPLYAYWNYGNGRVASFTSTLTGEWTRRWETGSGAGFFENLLSVNVPNERFDAPYTLGVEYDGSHSLLELIPVTLHAGATADVCVTLPDGSEMTKRLIFDSTRYFYRFETPLKGRYIIRITYAYGDKIFESEAAFHVGYSPEYNAFEVFDPAALHAAIRNRGTVSEGSVPTLQNNDKEVATYVVRFTVPLMIAAAVLYLLDVIIRKLTWNDLRSFFGFGAGKGGNR